MIGSCGRAQEQTLPPRKPWPRYVWSNGQPAYTLPCPVGGLHPTVYGSFRDIAGRTLMPTSNAERRARARVRRSGARVTYDAFSSPVVHAPSLAFARVAFEEYIRSQGSVTSMDRALFIPLMPGQWRVESTQ